MSTELATKTALQYASTVADNLKSLKSDSLIEYTQPTRVEPIVLVDDRVGHLDMTKDLMQSLASIFAGYYLQAVALTVNVGKVDVIRLLDRVNPNRSLTDNAIRSLTNAGIREGLESQAAYKYGLPVPGEPIGLQHFGLENVSLEDDSDPHWIISERDEIAKVANRDYERGIKLLKEKYDDAIEKAEDEDDKLKLKEEKEYILEDTKSKSASDLLKKIDEMSTGVDIDKDALKTATEAHNLSVGKLLQVTLEDGGRKATFPISLRLIVTTAPAKGVKQVLTVNNKKLSAKERFHSWRAGQIEFIRDLVLCQDLIDNHKKGMLNDPTGIYQQSRQRRRKNNLSAIFSGNPSIATASNIIVMSEETAKDVERDIGGRLKDFRTREKVFKETYTMLMAVVDTRWETVTIYHRSIDSSTELSARDIKNPSKDKGPDITEILKAYTMGNSPL